MITELGERAPVFTEVPTCPDCGTDKISLVQGKVPVHVIDIVNGVHVCGKELKEPIMKKVVK